MLYCFFNPFRFAVLDSSSKLLSLSVTEMKTEEESRTVKRNGLKKQAIESEDEEPAKVEMDVVVCDSLKDTQLFHLQLPCRKRDAFTDRANARLRFKKKAKVMEMRLDADMHSSSYDKDKIDRLPPRALDSSANMPPEVYEGRSFDSRYPLQYAVGVVKDSKLYLCPVDGSIEMRRSMAYINLSDKKRKTDDDGNTTGESESEGTSSTPQAIRVKFSRQETERQKKRREASALHRERTIAGENWTELKVEKEEVDGVASRLRTVCVSANGEEQKSEMDVNAISTLVTTTIGRNSEVKEVMSLIDCPSLSLLNASSLPHHLQIRSLMLKSLSISTSSLASHISPPIDSTQLVPLVRQFAHLVNGVWVVKSELLFHPPLTFTVRPSTMTESRAKLWRNARDFALSLIDGNLRVTRNTLSRVFHLSKADAFEVMSTVGEIDEDTKSWKLSAIGTNREAMDDDLLTVQVEEAEYWVERWREIMDQVGDKGSPKRIRRQSGK